ncbi:hypothetical protein BDF21DRAFT_395388 [Thamnidium elegans]|nr:hypothetical protein BDF21DRAFT_395388 [Thamnidium elegans]
MTDLIIFIESSQQLKQFINIAHLLIDPKSISYEYRFLSSNSIMSEVQRYCLVFQDQSFSKFVTWCSSQKLKRKHEISATRSSLRDILLEDIIKLPERYQQYITNLKQEGYRILGYCRKSKATGGNANVLESLQSMIVGLQKRSLIENVYVTVSCNSKTPMHRRDLKKSDIMNEISDVAGDDQGVQYLI